MEHWLDPKGTVTTNSPHFLFACSLILYFTINGFFGGYLLTRLHLPRLFSLLDNEDVRDAQRQAIDTRVTFSAMEPGEQTTLYLMLKDVIDARINDPDIGTGDNIDKLQADAKALFVAGKLKDAETVLRRALALNTENSDSLFYLCHILLSTPGNEAATVPLLDTLVLKSGVRAVAWKRLGYALLYTTDLTRSIEATTKYMITFPNDAGAFFNLARAYAKLGDKANAIVNLERAITINATVWKKQAKELAKGDCDFSTLIAEPKFVTLTT
jgi:tetratricopeptide (TPR) repeat protein